MPSFDAPLVVLIDYVLPIFSFFLAASLVHRISKPLARRAKPLGDLPPAKVNSRRYVREQTLTALISSAISGTAFLVAIIASLSLFVDIDTLVWVIGLFSAAFGLGARPFISDYLTGISFIFEDTFDVGDKIEIPLFPQRVEGVVEAVTLRITRIRGIDGELYTMPNGDIRLIRNFSRGSFSLTSVTLNIPSADIRRTLDTLESIKDKALNHLPNIIEPWRVISKSGELGEKAELTVIAKAKFGKGADLRTNLLAFLHEHLHGTSVKIADDPPSEPIIPPPNWHKKTEDPL